MANDLVKQLRDKLSLHSCDYRLHELLVKVVEAVEQERKDQPWSDYEKACKQSNEALANLREAVLPHAEGKHEIPRPSGKEPE